jgi:hypothetical protein
MKKIYMSLAGLILCGSMISQNAFNMQNPNKHKAVLNAKEKLPVFQSNNNGSRTGTPFSLWTEPIGDVMTNKGLDISSGTGDETVFIDLVYQDSTVSISDANGTHRVNSILLGSILDPKSTLIQAGNIPIVSKADPYTIDSLIIFGSYMKVTAAVDTLYTWLVWGDTLNTAVFTKKLSSLEWVAPISTWRHSVIGPKLTGAVAAVGNKVKAAAPSSNMMLVKYALQNTDTVGAAGHTGPIYIKLPSIATVSPGNIVSCFYTFVPGIGTHTTGAVAYNLGGAAQTTNGFCGEVWNQVAPVNTVNDYLDNQVDPTSWCMGATYDYGQRHLLYGASWAAYMLGDLTSAPRVAYKISGASTVGVNKIENNGFALGNNTPNPFSNFTKINYQISKVAENVSVQVYDIRGVKMFEKTQTGVQQGNYSVELNSVNYPAGIYFYSLTVDGNKITKKMIVSK